MATLMEGFELCPLSNENDLLGITEDNKQDSRVIVTNRRGVTIYKVSHQKPLHSWSTKASLSFTCPVVLNHTTLEYIAVQNHKSLRIWKSDDIDVNKWKRSQLSNPVYKILSNPTQEPVIVFENGAVERISSILQNPSDNFINLLDDDTTILSAELSEKNFVVLVLQNQKSKAITVNIHKIGETDDVEHKSQISKFVVEKPAVCSKADYLCHCLQLQSDYVSLLVLWSDGRVSTTDIDCCDVTNSRSLPSNVLFTIGNLGKSSPVAMVMLDDAYIAVIGCRDKTQEKESLTVFDLQFGTIHGKQEVKNKIENRAFRNRKLFKCGDYLFAAIGRSVMVYNFNCTPLSLGSVIGKCAGNDSLMSTIVWESGDDATKKSKKNKSNELDEYFSKLTDESKTLTLAEFQSIFTVIMDATLPPNKVVFTVLKLLHYITTRALADERFWPDKEILQLITRSQVGSSSCPDLFTLLVAKKDLFLLHHCFLRISDISEEYLVKCLQLYLSIKEDGPFDAVMDQIKINEMIKKLPVLLSECPIHPCKAFYINQILLCPCNDVFIVDYLRKLTVEQSMIFLEYLHFLLIKTPVCRKKPTKFPAFERTVEWICMILDAQFTQLLIFPDARDLLLQLHETVADKMVFFKELGSVELLLNQLKQRTELPSTQRKKDDTTLYRIEILKLKIQ